MRCFLLQKGEWETRLHHWNCTPWVWKVTCVQNLCDKEESKTYRWLKGHFLWQSTSWKCLFQLMDELKLMYKGRFCCIEQSLQVKLSLKKQHFSPIPSHTKTFLKGDSGVFKSVNPFFIYLWAVANRLSSLQSNHWGQTHPIKARSLQQTAFFPFLKQDCARYLSIVNCMKPSHLNWCAPPPKCSRPQLCDWSTGQHHHKFHFLWSLY